MIGMFVGNYDAVEPVDLLFEGRQTPKRLLLAQAGVHQEARLRCLQQRAVARAARRENAYAKADAIPPKRSAGCEWKMRAGMNHRKAARGRQSPASNFSRDLAAHPW